MRRAAPLRDPEVVEKISNMWWNPRNHDPHSAQAIAAREAAAWSAAAAAAPSCRQPGSVPNSPSRVQSPESEPARSARVAAAGPCQAGACFGSAAAGSAAAARGAPRSWTRSWTYGNPESVSGGLAGGPAGRPARAASPPGALSPVNAAALSVSTAAAAQARRPGSLQCGARAASPAAGQAASGSRAAASVSDLATQTRCAALGGNGVGAAGVEAGPGPTSGPERDARIGARTAWRASSGLGRAASANAQTGARALAAAWAWAWARLREDARPAAQRPSPVSAQPEQALEPDQAPKPGAGALGVPQGGKERPLVGRGDGERGNGGGYRDAGGRVGGASAATAGAPECVESGPSAAQGAQASLPEQAQPNQAPGPGAGALGALRVAAEARAPILAVAPVLAGRAPKNPGAARPLQRARQSVRKPASGLGPPWLRCAVPRRSRSQRSAPRDAPRHALRVLAGLGVRKRSQRTPGPDPAAHWTQDPVRLAEAAAADALQVLSQGPCLRVIGRQLECHASRGTHSAAPTSPPGAPAEGPAAHAPAQREPSVEREAPAPALGLPEGSELNAEASVPCRAPERAATVGSAERYAALWGVHEQREPAALLPHAGRDAGGAAQGASRPLLEAQCASVVKAVGAGCAQAAASERPQQAVLVNAGFTHAAAVEQLREQRNEKTLVGLPFLPCFGPAGATCGSASALPMSEAAVQRVPAPLPEAGVARAGFAPALAAEQLREQREAEPLAVCFLPCLEPAEATIGSLSALRMTGAAAQRVPALLPEADVAGAGFAPAAAAERLQEHRAKEPHSARVAVPQLPRQEAGPAGAGLAPAAAAERPQEQRSAEAETHAEQPSTPPRLLQDCSGAGPAPAAGAGRPQEQGAGASPAPWSSAPCGVATEAVASASAPPRNAGRRTGLGPGGSALRAAPGRVAAGAAHGSAPGEPAAPEGVAGLGPRSGGLAALAVPCGASAEAGEGDTRAARHGQPPGLGLRSRGPARRSRELASLLRSTQRIVFPTRQFSARDARAQRCSMQHDQAAEGTLKPMLGSACREQASARSAQTAGAAREAARAWVVAPLDRGAGRRMHPVGSSRLGSGPGAKRLRGEAAAPGKPDSRAASRSGTPGGTSTAARASKRRREECPADGRWASDEDAGGWSVDDADSCAPDDDWVAGGAIAAAATRHTVSPARGSACARACKSLRPRRPACEWWVLPKP